MVTLQDYCDAISVVVKETIENLSRFPSNSKESDKNND